MKKFILAVAAMAFLAFPQAQASILVEPLIGYNLATQFRDDNGGSGRAFGGRLGYQYLGLQLGADYLNSTVDVDDAKDFNSEDFGAFVGFQFPILLRVYAGYIFSSSGDYKLAGANVEAKDGSGEKFGIGFTGLPFLNINFEYRNISYDKIGGAKPTGNGGDYQSYLVSVSLPLNF